MQSNLYQRMSSDTLKTVKSIKTWLTIDDYIEKAYKHSKMICTKLPKILFSGKVYLYNKILKFHEENYIIVYENKIIALNN